MVACSKSAMGVFTLRKWTSTTDHGSGTNLPKEPVVKHLPVPVGVWNWVLYTVSPPSSSNTTQKLRVANGSKSWWLVPPGGSFKHPSSLTLTNLNPASWRSRWKVRPSGSSQEKGRSAPCRPEGLADEALGRLFIFLPSLSASGAAPP